MAAAYAGSTKSGGKKDLMEWIRQITQGAPNQTQASTVLGQLLKAPLEGRTSTNSSRALKIPDGTSAAWYILTIFGIYGVIFLFRLASNILQKNDRSLEEVYYSNLTSELKKKGLQYHGAKDSPLTISNGAVLQPAPSCLGILHGNGSPSCDTELSRVP